MTQLESGFFMTVHKAQGSEYEHVHLLLPPIDMPLLSNQMLFTAVTRARIRFSMHGSIDVFASGLSRQAVRYSGLAKRLEAGRPDDTP
jgi:exodeoxyribonuclease V alpha subunit